MLTPLRCLARNSKSIKSINQSNTTWSELNEYKTDAAKREKACGGKLCLPPETYLEYPYLEVAILRQASIQRYRTVHIHKSSKSCTKHAIAMARTNARALNATHSRSGTICICSTALPFHASITIPSTVDIGLATVLNTITACIAWLWIQYIACTRV